MLQSTDGQGTRIVQGTDTGATSQQWRVDSTGDRYVPLINRANGLPAGVDGSINGSAYIASGAGPATSQEWYLARSW